MLAKLAVSVGGVVAAAVMIAASVSGPSAHAATLSPASSTSAHAASNPVSCSYDLCITATSINGNVASIEAWSRANLTGHFELQMPNHRVANSPNQPWYAGGYGYEFANWNGGYGEWCVTLWDHRSVGGWFTDGYTCVLA